jgi:hypothetical protein
MTEAASAEPANRLFLVWVQRVSHTNRPGSVLSPRKPEAALEWVKSMLLRDVPLRKDEPSYGVALLRTVMRWCLTSVELGMKAHQLILFVRCEQDGPKECHRKRIGSSRLRSWDGRGRATSNPDGNGCEYISPV